MPQDYIKKKGAVKSSKNTAGGSNVYSAPVFGIVKDNIDPLRSGRIKVFIGEPGAKNANIPTSWVTVRFLSSFFGKVEPTAPQTGLGTYKENSSSYGQWQSPPDIGTVVLCVFVNGDPNYGFYLGGVLEPELLQMIPAIGSSDYVVANEGQTRSLSGTTRLPVTNINTNNKKNADSDNFNKTARPVHSYTASIMSQQGIIRDPIRGPISSSASREPASRVGWGVSTPGRPIYEGGYTDETLGNNLNEDNSEKLKIISRRGGHSIVMDDGDLIGNDQLIRIRTALGHQILMSDDGQTLMILHSNGQSYIELGKEGTVDIYTTNSFNVRSQGDINFHADQHMNFHAGEKMNFYANSVQMESEENIKLRSGKDINQYSLGDVTTKSEGSIALTSTKETSVASVGSVFATGAKINLNTGKCGLEPKKLNSFQLNAQTDTLFDETTGFSAAPGKLMTITTRTPAHAPWVNAGQGVDVKVNLNASAQFPSRPNQAVINTNNQAAELSSRPPSLSTISSVPSVAPVSESVNTGATNAVLGAVATSSATGPLQSSVKYGASIADGGEGIVGSFSLNPTQMSTAGVTKPGSDYMINVITKSTGNVAHAYPSCVFTGAPGAPDINTFATEVSSQSTALSSVSQKAQTELTKAGVISGKESTSQLAGLITGAAISGTIRTIDAISKLSNGSSTSLVDSSGLYSGKIDVSAGSSGGQFGDIDVYTVNSRYGSQTNILQTISLGQAAAAVTSKVGGIFGISSALLLSGLANNSADTTRGSEADAYDAIKDSYAPLKPNVPQNLNAISKNVSTVQTIKENTGSSNITLTPTYLDVVSSISSDKSELVISEDVIKMSNSVKSDIRVSDATINGLTGSSSVVSTGQINKLSPAATFVQSGSSGTVSSQRASGVTSVAGGAASFGTIVDNSSNSNSTYIPTPILTSIIKEAQTSTMYNVPTNFNLANQEGSLNQIVKGSLTPNETAKLESTISSLSIGTPSSTKLPTIGYNTFDRNSITAQIDTIISDEKVPKPNLIGSVKNVDKSKKETQDKIDKEQKNKATEDKIAVLKQEITDAYNSYQLVLATYPEGDPIIQKNYKKYEALKLEYESLRKNI